jgi:hypothetical protein
MDLTKNQLIEIDLLINASMDLILSSVEGVAQVAKRIQLYLGCEFSEAVNILNIFISEM